MAKKWKRAHQCVNDQTRSWCITNAVVGTTKAHGQKVRKKTNNHQADGYLNFIHGNSCIQDVHRNFFVLIYVTRNKYIKHIKSAEELRNRKLFWKVAWNLKSVP